MPALTLEQASRIIDGALDHARQLNLKPLAVAVLDAGGHLIAFKRQDRSGILRHEIAHGKAWGALGLGIGGRALAQRAEVAPTFVAALTAASNGRVIPVVGGVLITDGAQEIIGAVGISGDLSNNDEACAIYGIEQAGLRADPGVAH